MPVIISKDCSSIFDRISTPETHLLKNARNVTHPSSDSTMPVPRTVRKRTIPPRPRGDLPGTAATENQGTCCAQSSSVIASSSGTSSRF